MLSNNDFCAFDHYPCGIFSFYVFMVVEFSVSATTQILIATAGFS
jgi:hypothetical protein